MTRPRPTPRILLVDDNKEILALAAATLASSCEIVGSVSNGSEALAAYRAAAPDVIVLDISMPGVSGFEVAAQLRREVERAPIVFLSVYEDEALIRAAYAHGGAAYVVKSRLSSELLPAVLAAAARYRSIRLTNRSE